MKNMKPSSENPPILDLPSHILSIIISCLPTKSILCCKLVCKLWCCIIKSPHFKLPSNRIAIIVRRSGVSAYRLNNKDLYLVEPELDFVIEGHYHDLCLRLRKLAVTRFTGCSFDGISVKKLQVVNACNGLVCLTSTGKNLPCQERRKQIRKFSVNWNWIWGSFFVCNPVTSDYVVVKQPVENEQLCREEHCGLGFSAKSGQYKVLMLKRRCDNVGPLMAEIYTLGCDEEWRRIENPPQNYRWEKDRLFFEGSLHWIVFYGEGNVGSIVAFEFQEEKFSLVSLPITSDDFGRIHGRHLTILYSQLCYYVWGGPHRDYEGQCDIWVMNDYGVEESWRKLFVVISPDFMISKPLAFLNNGEILCSSENYTGCTSYNSYNVISEK